MLLGSAPSKLLQIVTDLGRRITPTQARRRLRELSISVFSQSQDYVEDIFP